ncbi:MAG: hypothetical protein R3F55_09360 [Alphaproteobacteria bacterium]
MSSPDAAVFRLRDMFVGWQCRIRQHAMRSEGGRPPAGARPAVTDDDGAALADAVTTLMLKREPQDDTARFRHMATRTHDPAERYGKALEYLCGDYYQQARAFADVLCALFGTESALALALLREGRCVLVFEQFRQRFCIPCAVTEASREHPAFQATYWHNALFNPNMPPAVRVLLFKPRWLEASADPPPPA